MNHKNFPLKLQTIISKYAKHNDTGDYLAFRMYLINLLRANCKNSESKLNKIYNSYNGKVMGLKHTISRMYRYLIKTKVFRIIKENIVK